MKYLFALLIITSIFINWTYSTPSEKAGITGWGMKTEIKDQVVASQSDVSVKCKELRGRICISPEYKFHTERDELLEMLAHE